MMFKINNDIKDLLHLPPELVFKRVKGKGRPIAQVIPEITTIISEWQSVDELCYLIEPRKTIQLTEEVLTQHISWLNQKAAESISKAFILSDGKWKSEGYLAISLGYHSNLERLKIPISSEFLKLDFSTDRLIEAVTKIGQSFEAFTGYVYEHTVAVLNSENNIPLTKFDSSKVPYGVWWVNYWSQEQVETVGRGQIVNLNWFRVIELPNGDIVTAVTSKRPDFHCLEDIQRFEQFIQLLDLKNLQRNIDPPTDFRFDTPG